MASTVEIGSLRERVEIIDAPSGERIGRLRRPGGENVAIDERTLAELIRRADVARAGPNGALCNRGERVWLIA